MESLAHQVTQLLQAWKEGEEGALERLVPLVYQELHRLAQTYMAHERPGHILQTTALVNEAYLRLIETEQANWRNRAHFFAACSQVMRRILVDWARNRQALKRAGGIAPLQLEEALVVAAEPDVDIAALDDAIGALAALDARKGQVVEMRFFGGLSVEETADVLRISVETVMRDWKFAKSWLRRELRKEACDGVRALRAG